MPQGKIKFLDLEKYWGVLIDQDSNQSIFFHFTDVEQEIKPLFLLGKLNDEPLVFEIVDSERKPNEKKAIKVNIDTSKRKLGYIKEFNSERGHGKVEDYNTKEKIFFHIANLKKETGKEDKFIRIEVNEPIIFTLSKNEKGKVADEIALVDNRYQLECFSKFTNFKQALLDLCELAEDEKKWDYITRPRGNMPILFSYINQTFKQIESQNKIKHGKSTKDGREYCYFNTGLVNIKQEEIYGYFINNPNYTPLLSWGILPPKWLFLEFETENSNYRRYFAEDAEIATYFREAQVTDLIFDTTVKIIPDKEHLVKRKSRIESEAIKNLDDDTFVEAIKESIELAIKRIKRNYKTAIPHYYEGKIQFLLPLCFRANRAKALGALVVNKNENIYEAHTILSLDQALNNARLLAKPDREWLNP